MKARWLLWSWGMAALAWAEAGRGAQPAYVAHHLGYGFAYDVNESGTIVGAAGAGWPKRAFRFAEGELTEIGTLGGDWSIAYALNDLGESVGVSANSNGVQRAFRHIEGSLFDLDGLGSLYTAAYRINNAGTIIGVRGDHAFVLSNGVFTDLGSLGGRYSAAYGINHAGAIVGESDVALPGHHAFIYTNGMMKDLGNLGGINSSARAINDQGVIVGTYQTPRGDDIAFSLTGGTRQLLGSLGGPSTYPSDINNAGVVVGNSYVNFTNYHAFVHRDGVMTDLAPLLTGIGLLGPSQALGLNDRGDIVGWGEDGEGRPCAFLLAVPVACPSLTISRQGTDVVLRWPSSRVATALETADTLSPTAWSRWPALPSLDGSNLVVVAEGRLAKRFFRLRCE